MIERQKQGLSSAPEDENGNLPKYILSPNDLVYVPTQEEINKGEVVMPIDRDRIYKMVDSSGITANFIPASTANLILLYLKLLQKSIVMVKIAFRMNMVLVVLNLKIKKL